MSELQDLQPQLREQAGVGDSYECGISSRVTGWLEAASLKYEMTPPLGKCQKLQGLECAYSFRVEPGAA